MGGERGYVHFTQKPTTLSAGVNVLAQKQIYYVFPLDALITAVCTELKQEGVGAMVVLPGRETTDAWLTPVA